MNIDLEPNYFYLGQLKQLILIHRKECEKLLDALTEEEKVKAEKASMLTARYLWNFLSGMSTKHKIQAAA